MTPNLPEEFHTTTATATATSAYTAVDSSYAPQRKPSSKRRGNYNYKKQGSNHSNNNHQETNNKKNSTDNTADKDITTNTDSSNSNHTVAELGILQQPSQPMATAAITPTPLTYPPITTPTRHRSNTLNKYDKHGGPVFGTTIQHGSGNSNSAATEAAPKVSSGIASSILPSIPTNKDFESITIKDDDPNPDIHPNERSFNSFPDTSLPKPTLNMSSSRFLVFLLAQATELFSVSIDMNSIISQLSMFFSSITTFQSLKTIKFLFLCVLWYASSAVTNNIGKSLLNVFPYPVTLTWIQFGFVSLYCHALGRLGFTRIRRLTVDILKETVPLSGFQIVGHGFSSVATSQVPVSFVHTIKNVFSKTLLRRPDMPGEEKLDKLNLMFFSSTIAFVLMIPIWAWYDGLKFGGFLVLGGDLGVSASVSAWTILFYFFLNGTTHFFQNTLAFNILEITSPVTYSIASLVKRIFVITASIIWFGQKTTFVQGVGIFLTFIGLHLYNRAKSDVDKKERKVSGGEKLPMTRMRSKSIK
ncbi:4888_t:CDS:2 [Paraglomus occultum]|uniref:4888_t:CDS:1 n=1 Tax=Paraglomus occultum TaxID=144539 RepID=A0A9N9BIQ9_9GLOM|nr:4888_t:CDS:2 [Paraglomus occultum]